MYKLNAKKFSGRIKLISTYQSEVGGQRALFVSNVMSDLRFAVAYTVKCAQSTIIVGNAHLYSHIYKCFSDLNK